MCIRLCNRLTHSPGGGPQLVGGQDASHDAQLELILSAYSGVRACSLNHQALQERTNLDLHTMVWGQVVSLSIGHTQFRGRRLVISAAKLSHT